MLNNSQGIASTEQSCKPDPEEMLQSARKQKEREQAVLDAYKQFIISVNYLDRDSEIAARQILGELTLKVWQAETNEKRWLDEIDK